MSFKSVPQTTILSVFLLVFFIALPSTAHAIALYETYEVSVTNSKSYANKFDYQVITLSAEFTSPTGKKYQVLGFHDGNGSGSQTGNVWKIRFMPDEKGTWRYQTQWSDSTAGTNGSFSVTDRTNPLNHGHVKLDGKYLRHSDGTPHYFIGGKWIGAEAYGPSSKGSETNNPTSDTVFLNYFNELKTYEHNGLLLKTALFPLENDKISWDVSWINRGEALVGEMLKRGIYVHINFFDTWARDKNKWFANNTSGSMQVFNVWATGDEHAKENYIKTIVARFSGYANVYWELGNEMEHSPNSGSAFATQANQRYIPWIKAADPYDLPIGLSEGVWKSTNVDIGFLHQADTFPNAGSSKPQIMNELVRGGDTGSLYSDSVIRNPDSRYSYRRTFWQNFTFGGSGSSEATWLSLDTSLNSAVRNVMSDHQKLRQFIESLPVDINQMNVISNWISAGPANTGFSKTSALTGNTYVTYFKAGGSISSGSVTLSSLPSGSYQAQWLNPTTLQPIATTSLSGGSNIRLNHPSFNPDIILLVTKSATSPTNTPPTATPKPTTPPTSTPTILKGDYDQDGDVDFLDLVSLLPFFDTTGQCRYNLTGSSTICTISIFDFNALVSSFGL